MDYSTMVLLLSRDLDSVKYYEKGDQIYWNGTTAKTSYFKLSKTPNIKVIYEKEHDFSVNDNFDSDFVLIFEYTDYYFSFISQDQIMYKSVYDIGTSNINIFCLDKHSKEKIECDKVDVILGDFKNELLNDFIFLIQNNHKFKIKHLFRKG